MTAQDHNRLLGIFHLIQGGLQTFGGLMVGLIYGIMGIVFSANAHRPEEQFMGTMFIVLAFIVAPITLIFAGINLIAGWKMYKEKSGARTWGIVASILCLPGVPLGTALGVYGLWFLFGEEGKKFHQESENQNYLNPPNVNNYNDFHKTHDYEKQPHNWK